MHRIRRCRAVFRQQMPFVSTAQSLSSLCQPPVFCTVHNENKATNHVTQNSLWHSARHYVKIANDLFMNDDTPNKFNATFVHASAYSV